VYFYSLELEQVKEEAYFYSSELEQAKEALPHPTPNVYHSVVFKESSLRETLAYYQVWQTNPKPLQFDVFHEQHTHAASQSFSQQ